MLLTHFYLQGSEHYGFWLTTNSFHVPHIHSHTGLPRPTAEGNCADLTVMLNIVRNKFAQAKLSHYFFHQNVHFLRKQFQLTSLQAHDILLSCPSCHGVALAPLAESINPWGLTANSIWQTDVIHVAEFGNLKYVHVTVDTFSHFLMATIHTGEKGHDVSQHWLTCFATLGFLDAIKMDNGLAYASEQTLPSYNNGVSPTIQVPLTLPLVRLSLNILTEY